MRSTGRYQIYRRFQSPALWGAKWSCPHSAEAPDRRYCGGLARDLAKFLKPYLSKERVGDTLINLAIDYRVSRARELTAERGSRDGRGEIGGTDPLTQQHEREAY